MTLRVDLRFATCFPAAWLVLIVLAADAPAEWHIEPVYSQTDAGWDLHIDLDNAGRPHASFYTSSSTSIYPLMSRTGGGWTQTGSFTFGLHFTLDQAGTPYYLNEPSPGFNPRIGIVGGAPPSAPIQNVSVSDGFLAFDSQNRPAVTYIDVNARTLRSARLLNGSWLIQDVATTENFRFGNSYAASTLDDTDILHAVFPTGPSFSNGTLSYAKWSPGGWTVTETGLGGFAMDLAVDASGTVHVLRYLSDTGTVQLSKFAGAGWNTEALPLAGIAREARLALDVSGKPHVFVRTQQTQEILHHLYLENGSWQTEVIAQWSDQTDGPEAIAAIIDENNIHVLYSTGSMDVFYATRPVPEPGTLTLAVVGLASLAWCGKLRRRRPA